jgi:hypothetical protein
MIGIQTLTVRRGTAINGIQTLTFLRDRGVRSLTERGVYSFNVPKERGDIHCKFGSRQYQI